MTEAKNKELALLDDVLDAYGADRTRWPAVARREISALLAQSAEARSRQEAAAAFDRLLDTAPSPDADRMAVLADRIMDRARTTPRVVATTPASRLGGTLPVLRRHAGGIAALAASLMLGVFAGQSASMAPTVSELVELAGIETAGNQIAALPEDGDANLDGDLL